MANTSPLTEHELSRLVVARQGRENEDEGGYGVYGRKQKRKVVGYKKEGVRRNGSAAAAAPYLSKL